MMDIFNDVLTTERRLSHEKGFQKSENESDNTQNFSQMNFFVNPTYSAGKDAKPYTTSSKYIKKKRKRERKSAHATELTQLLALAEIRFLDSVNKIKEAIVMNKKIHLIRIISFIRSIYPIVKRVSTLVKKTYLYKWICIHRESNLNRKPSLAFKLWSFTILWKKITKRNKIRALILFRERGIIYEFGIQYYGIDSISKKKLSRFVPPFRKEEANKLKLEKLVAPIEKTNSIVRALKNTKIEKSYFHK